MLRQVRSSVATAHVLGPKIVEYREALSSEVCARAIELFEADPDTKPGVIDKRDGPGSVVDPAVKRSTDYLIGPNSGPDWLAVDEQMTKALFSCFAKYSADNQFLKDTVQTFCGFQIQRSEAGDFFDWHIDDDGQRRRVAIIIYLNEGFEGGETEFREPEIKVRARTGSLLLFPPYWTHVHRGAPVVSGVKYIATSFLLAPQA